MNTDLQPVDDVPVEQLVELAFDQRESTIRRLVANPALAARVDDIRSAHIKTKARAIEYSLMVDMYNGALATEDVSKKAAVWKAIRTAGGRDEQVAVDNDKVVLIIQRGDGQSVTIEAGAPPEPEPIEAEFSEVPEETKAQTAAVVREILAEGAAQREVAAQSAPVSEEELNAVVSEMFGFDDD